MDYARALRSSTERIAGSEYEIDAIQHNTTITCGHAQSVIGPECSNDPKGSGLYIIAFSGGARLCRLLGLAKRVSGIMVWGPPTLSPVSLFDSGWYAR